MFYAQDFQTIVIDNGSTTIRAGFAGENVYSTSFPSVVGRPKDPNVLVGMGQKDAYVGDAIGRAMRSHLVERNPIERGIITNWADMEKIWYHTFFNELRVDPEEHPVLLTEVGLNPKSHREKMAEIMFEVFNVPALYIAPAGALSLYSHGRTTGVVLSSGGGVTQAIPIYELHPIQHGITQLDIGGNDITDYLIKLIYDSHNINLNTMTEREEINYIKTKCTYVALDYQNELLNPQAALYDLYEGHITLKNQRFQAPEILFDPTLFGRETGGVHELIFNAVMKSDESIRQELLNNIAIEGGNGCIPGFAERLSREMKTLVPDKNIYVIPADNTKYAAWLGGSMLGSYGIFLQWCMSKQEYNEEGPRAINRIM